MNFLPDLKIFEPIVPFFSLLFVFCFVVVAFSLVLRGFRPKFTRAKLLNRPETQLYKLLVRDVPQGWVVMCQVSYGAMVANKSFGRYSTINAKRADFVILDTDLAVRAVIEYQGTGHFGFSTQGRKRAKASDAVKRKALREAGLLLIEVPAKIDPEWVRSEVRGLTLATAVSAAP